MEIEESLKRLDEDFDREHLHSRYRGIYYGRSAARRAENVASLFEGRDANPASLSELYPPFLSEDIEHLRTLVREEALLQSISDGTLDPPGGVIRHRGREVPRSGLDAVIDLVKRERAELEARLAAQERLCRSVHLAIASQTGGGWRNYLVGLCSLVHYAVHTKADLRDAQGALGAVYRVATATGTVSGDKLYWIQAESGRLYSVLERVFAQEDQIAVDADTAKLMGAASWRDALGSLLLPDPANDNLGIGVWLSRIDSWVNQAAGALESLRCAALDRLLISERELTEHFFAGSDPGPAPELASLPTEYPVLLPGKERERMKGLDWWTRFQIARGPGPALARTGTALAIVGGVLAFGAMTGQARLVAYNGLARPVKVIVDGSTRRLVPGEKAEYSLTPGRRYAIEARADDGRPIEAFSESLSEDTATYVYNVAGAAALASYTIYYGDGEPPPAPPNSPRPAGSQLAPILCLLSRLAPFRYPPVRAIPRSRLEPRLSDSRIPSRTGYPRSNSAPRRSPPTPGGIRRTRPIS